MSWDSSFILSVIVQVVLLPFYIWVFKKVLKVERKSQESYALLSEKIVQINERCRGRGDWIDTISDDIKATNKNLARTNDGLQKANLQLATLIGRLENGDRGGAVRT